MQLFFGDGLIYCSIDNGQIWICLFVLSNVFYVNQLGSFWVFDVKYVLGVNMFGQLMEMMDGGCSWVVK